MNERRRQIVVDTETTGLLVSEGHRLIEVGCIELGNRRFTGNNFHARINPERSVDEGAQSVHGISDRDVLSAPKFSQIANVLWDYLSGAELIIHNAAFDLEFLNLEFSRAGITESLENHCTIIDTLALARKIHPGQKNSLDALCKRYAVDTSARTFHGALIDAALLADVYLAMTGGQSALSFKAADLSSAAAGSRFLAYFASSQSRPLPVIRASDEELVAHDRRMAEIAKIHQKALEEKAKLLAAQKAAEENAKPAAAGDRIRK